MLIWDQFNVFDIEIDHQNDGQILLKQPLVEQTASIKIFYLRYKLFNQANKSFFTNL